MDYCYKYCVVEVVFYGGEPHLCYCGNDNGACMFTDYHDPRVTWYDTVAEAKEHLWNYNDCVISRMFENGVVQ